jgi:predicted  nucleic acid-binding Zn-ribbon protein
MHPDLDKLIRLQQAETDMRRVLAERAEVPRRRAELEAALAQERGALQAARAALEASQKARRAHEGELQTLEARRAKYRGQLMEVKTNKEYTAMLHEIEAVEREIRAREDQVLVEMEKADGLQGEVEREEAAFKAVEGRFHGEGRTLDEAAARLDAEARAATAGRDAALAAVPEEPRELFLRIARLRGAGVAEARDGMCSQCHLKLRLQMWADIRRNEALIQCPGCSRILFYETPVPVVGPEA